MNSRGTDCSVCLSEDGWSRVCSSVRAVAIDTSSLGDPCSITAETQATAVDQFNHRRGAGTVGLLAVGALSVGHGIVLITLALLREISWQMAAGGPETSRPLHESYQAPLILIPADALPDHSIAPHAPNDQSPAIR